LAAARDAAAEGREMLKDIRTPGMARPVRVLPIAKKVWLSASKLRGPNTVARPRRILTGFLVSRRWTQDRVVAGRLSMNGRLPHTPAGGFYRRIRVGGDPAATIKIVGLGMML
jgi:hypothetical protein